MQHRLARHQSEPDPLWNKTPAAKKRALFGPADFTYDDEAQVCICLAGEFLYQNGSRIWELFCLVHHIEKLAHHGYAQ